MKLLLFIAVLFASCASRTYQPLVVQHSFSVEQLQRLNIDTAQAFRSIDIDVSKSLNRYLKNHK